MRPGVKLDFTQVPSGHVVTASELEEAFTAISYQPKPFDIVLMNTSAGAVYGTRAYLHAGCGFGREATLWLCDRGVVVVGTDAWSWDAPFSHTRQRFASTGDPSIIWEGHKAGRERAYCQIEKLANLDKLPNYGFTICCFHQGKRDCFSNRGGECIKSPFCRAFKCAGCCLVKMVPVARLIIGNAYKA